ncbi:MAG: hypothetical protein WDN06_09315 [Asticcacaulis sp.]
MTPYAASCAPSSRAPVQRRRADGRPLAAHWEDLGSADHRAVARKAVRESLVLIKNQGGVPAAEGFGQYPGRR